MAHSALHARSIVIDGTCPADHWLPNYRRWREGGATCCVVSVATVDSARTALRLFGEFFRFMREHADEVVLVTSSREIRAAKADGRLAVLVQFQGTHAIEYDVDLLEVYHRIGVRTIQLAYNHVSPVADGCEEPRDAGLSTFGHQVVAEMNRLGIVVDVSHTGYASSRDAVAASTAPVIASHSNATAVHASRRNLPDDLIQAIASSDGIIGINGFPSFVSADTRPTLDQYVDHAAHVAHVAGSARHVAIGLDYWERDPGREVYDEFIRNGRWKAESYPPPPWHYPAGLDDASGLPNLTERLLARGFSEQDVTGILGENWLRVLDAAQAAATPSR